MTENPTDDGSNDGKSQGDANRRRFLKGLGTLGVAGAAGCLNGGDGDSTPTEAPPGTDTDTPTDTPTPTPISYSVLVLSVTKGVRHDVIPAGNEALQAIAGELAEEPRVEEVAVDVIDSADNDDFQSEIPSSVEEFQAYDAVVFQNTTGPVLNSDQQSAFREYVEGGGGYMGIHAAAETHADWDWYGTELLGTTATGSPAVQQAEIHVTDRTHPSTEGLPARWTREDEWYDYEPNPRGDVHVLATLDERTYDNAGMDDQWGRDHPIAWCGNVGAGRSFYTGGGDTPESFGEDAFREHLKGGLLWAVGHAGGRAYGTVWDAYEVERFYQPENEPIEMVVTPDGRAVYVERTGVGTDDQGAVVVVDPDTGEGTVALELSVYLAEDTLNGYGRESGLLGITLDPDFEENGWLYLYYTTETNDGVVNRVSRFTMEGGSIDPGTETQIIDIPVFGLNHQGGALTVDTQGNLYIGPGDDTTPFESSGYTPIDEVRTPDTFDAQRSSANTNDLRGSVLRISPNEDGSYDIPEGNLFTEENGYGDVNDGLVKKEIYGMGFRNPFTIKVDPETDVPYVGDYGPDNGSWNAQRGPPGQTEFERLDEPGFYGWPYVKGKNVPYKHYDFETGESGRLFDPDNPVNDSAKNTGLTQLPPSKNCMITNPYSWFTLLDNPPEWDEYMPYDSVDEVPFPQVTGGAPTQGPVYRHREEFSVTSALHASYEGKIFLAEYGAGWIKYGTLDDDDEIMEVDPFLPEESFSSPIDMTVGPDGALYVVEYSGRALTRISTDDAVLPVDVSLDGPLQGEVVVGSRNTVTMTAQIANTGGSSVTDVEASLEASSSDLSVSANTETTFGTIESGASETVKWDVTVPGDAEGDYSLEAVASYTSGGSEFEVTDVLSFTAS